MELMKHRSTKCPFYPKKFFCCISLEVGGLIVGWFWTIKSILFLAIATVYLATGKPALPPNVNVDSVLVLVITSSTANLIVSLVLILAVTNDKPYLILPWLIVNLLTTTFATFGYATGLDNFGLFIALVAIGLFCYVWWCVLSLHHRLRYPHWFDEPSDPEADPDQTDNSMPPYTIHKDEV